MKKIITFCLGSLLLGSALPSYADYENAVFSVTNNNSDTFYVGIYPYLRNYNNSFTKGSYYDTYTARKWGATSPCGHTTHVEVRDANAICPLKIYFKLAKCKNENEQVLINIVNSNDVTLASSTDSISDISYIKPPHGCGNPGQFATV